MSSYRSISIEEQELMRMVEAEKEQWNRWSIYKLPACVTNKNKTAYTPQMVSFGPYHYGNEDLKQIEFHKKRALNHFLKRSRLNYSDCRRSLLEIIGELMDAYDSLDSKLYNKQNPDAFLDIMIRDGVIMLEIFSYAKKGALGYADNDPIFSEHGYLYFVPQVKSDMLMIENQIPMKVLHKLYQLQFKEKYPNKWQEADANEVVFQFFFQQKIGEVPPNNSLHVLDMYRTVLLGRDDHTESEGHKHQMSSANVKRSAVELTQAGVKIQKCNTSKIQHVRFEKGILRLPRIVVDDTTESLFLNLIAYERFHAGAGNELTAFTIFMDSLIDDKKDVKLLQSKNIIHNVIGSDKTAANLFNSLSKNLSLNGDNKLVKTYRCMNAYCESKMRRHRASLYGTYFTNPWAIISFVAGILIFILTITQTGYNVADFHTKDKN